jgi:hypothetical protein
MASHADLQEWVVQSLRDQGGAARVPDIAKGIWDKHEAELRASGDLFYTWQYAMRWAAQQLQQRGQLKKDSPKKGHWSLTGAAA